MTQILLPGPRVRERRALATRSASPGTTKERWARQLCHRVLEKLRRMDATESSDVSAACWQAVQKASPLLRRGAIDQAAAVLRAACTGEPVHAGWLNLMGVICESRGDWRRARRYYGKAMRANHNFAPAEQNMRRWYELFTFGRTKLPVALGDDRIEY